MRLRRYRDEDMERINPRRVFIEDPSVSNWSYLASMGDVFTIENGSNTPVAILGCHVLWKGVGQIWMIPSEGIRGHGVYVVKTILRLMKTISEINSLHRYHCIVHSGIAENVKFIKLLGFYHEGTMKQAAPDKSDIYIYARLYN